MAERVRNLLSLPRRQLRALFPAGVPRWLWLIFQLIALALAGVGAYYAWREFPRDVQIEPVFFALAVGLYIPSFGMHLLGWHALSHIFFSDGDITLIEDVEAIAGSNLVKYLPTIVWYIANRSHFYHARGVAQRSVVVASLSELALMVGSGATLLVTLWAARSLSPLAAVPLCLTGFAALLWALARHAGGQGGARRWYWGVALAWYGGSWLMGALIMWSIMRAFVPIDISDLLSVVDIWLLAGLASYAVSLTLGAIGIAREITLTVLLAQHWPLAAGIAAAIVVKLLLTLGEIGCSLIILGCIQLWRRLAAGSRAGEVP
jgi:hypothetical protein